MRAIPGPREPQAVACGGGDGASGSRRLAETQHDEAVSAAPLFRIARARTPAARDLPSHHWRAGAGHRGLAWSALASRCGVGAPLEPGPAPGLERLFRRVHRALGLGARQR